ncbi:transglutaminase family protein [Cellulophaga baltica]|uniref:transglutaminase-like domain-containing protein n=1 Tax=Cellulophaga TaxID=104264 RepID=UPI001C06B6EF|nr:MULTISPECIES: transglutaminase family protein [Cellulophaga]MBU2996122.1 transglutaminase family protein [Cellulophaga baltica]MDO6767517.1 transglutaminase family protein [Cellulophaga sp. 1_MG-2023]
MYLEYTINYCTNNTYESLVKSAFWQFLIQPETNETQELIAVEFKNSLNIPHEFSINGYGFNSIRVTPKKAFKEIHFYASFTLKKKEIALDLIESKLTIEREMNILNSLYFKVDFESFLKTTSYTQLQNNDRNLYLFDWSLSVLKNLQNLNSWVFNYIKFKANTTTVNSTLDEVITIKHGVCQDFTHLFCAIARLNKIPARYVSGYLHQGNGYFGDSQMHAWAETYVPSKGWVGFDPTNNLFTNSNHIKVCHGKDYKDCAPLKGVVFALGKNKTSHTVQVLSQQQ